MKALLAQYRPTRYASAPSRGRGGQYMRQGSQNGMVRGDEFVRAFKGVTLQAGKLGSRILFNADQSYAGLGTGAVNGTGAAFVVRQLLMAIGGGQVNFSGAAISSFSASSTLSYIKKSGGVYAAGATTGPFQAGRARPSAPLIFAKDDPSAGKTAMSGTVSVVIWRLSSIDGQVSLMSLPSNVLSLSAQSVIVQMPAADSNGQDAWGIGVVKVGFDDLGNYYELPTSLGGETLESALTTVDGISRAVEISWTNGALQGQNLAPDKAFPPVAAQFAGAVNDVLYLDADGIIYVSEPNYIGSFAPSNTIFTSEPAVHYLRVGAGAVARFGKHSIGILSYVGGRPALEYQEMQNHLGITLPQNVALGFGGRLLCYLGRPAVFDNSLEPDYDYAAEVLPDFDGWEAQTTAAPVCLGYDGLGQYEVWAYQKKVMARHAPSGAWCSPQDLTGKINGNIMAMVTHLQKLYLSCLNGSSLELYQYDAGTGSTMIVQTDDTAPEYDTSIHEVFYQGRADNTANNIKVELIINFNDAAPVTVVDTVAPATGAQIFARQSVNINNAQSHALRVTMTCTGGDMGLDLIETYGSRTMVVY